MFLKYFAAVCIVAGSATPVLADKCLSYEPATVALTGKLSTAHGYGPPGFGEDPKHDSKELYGILTLDKPICVSGGAKDSMDQDVRAIGAIQLAASPGGHLNPKLVGQRVAVSGYLFHRVSGGHTDVLISYTSIHKAPADVNP